MKDLYAILGVSKTASQDDIKRAYRKLARDKHPDLDPDNPWAEDEFKELSAAYDLLSDLDKRGQYDRGEIDADGNRKKAGRNKRWNQGFGGGADQAGDEKPFDWYFKNRRNKEKAGVKVKGANVTYNLSVSFADAAQGAERQISMTNGKKLNVRIPPGTDDGQVLRLKGQGTPGIGGGEPGDALVEIAVQPNAQFQRNGLDVTVEATVELDIAVLGGKIETTTIHGPVMVSVPPGSNTGAVLRLKDRGIRISDAKQGDHYVRLVVKLPDHPDKELEAALKAWAERTRGIDAKT